MPAKPRPRATTRKRVSRPVPRAASSRPERRADYGAPVDGFFAKQPPHLREILLALHEIIDATAPKAQSGLKWGMPWYMLDGKMMCAVSGHKAHVNLILPGPLDAYADPNKRLSGASKLGRHLQLRSIEELPRGEVRRWIKTAAKLAREK